MEIAKKFLEENLPVKALERLKEILITVNPADEWKIHELFSAAFHDVGEARGAMKANFNAMHTDTILRDQRRHFSNYLFTKHYLSEFDVEEAFKAAQIYNTLYRDVDINFQITTPRTEKKIHVAFVAPYRYDSSAARFYEPLLTSYDKEKFFVSLWTLFDNDELSPFQKNRDYFSRVSRHKVDKYFDVSEVSFEEIAQRISEAGADIFFDLGGHTEGGATLQIAAYKPARVRMTSCIGYFDTTGLDAIDFYLTDKFLINGNEKYFTEKVLPLESIFAFKPNRRMHIYLRNDETPTSKIFTFACYNNFMKITNEYLQCVKAILDAVPESIMLFRDTTPLKSRQKMMIDRLEEVGFPMDRVDVLCSEYELYLYDYQHMDLVLDTFPYTGGMMTALALYMGVPVLNLCGQAHSQRLGADMLRLAGLEDFIVTNVLDYVNAAIHYARCVIKSDSGDIDSLPNRFLCPFPSRKVVPRLNSKLFDTKSFVKNFYDTLESVMNNWSTEKV